MYFESISRTLEEAREKDKTITMSDINEFFRKNVDQKRMLMIDIFDKFMHVVAIKGKYEEDLASAMIECLHKMRKAKNNLYRRRRSNEQGGNTEAFTGTEHRTSQD